jgi:transcriptional regulator with XRE-family HTH domain
MITNDRQRRITAAQIRRFEQAAERAQASGPTDDLDPRLHKAMIAGIESQLDDLRTELEEYEALRQGKVKSRVFHSLLELPDALIEGRITLGLTQKQLAQKIGVPEQQIQRYEQTRYSGASLERLQEAADAVKLVMQKKIEYPIAAKASAKGGAAKRSAGATASTVRAKRGGVTRIKRKAAGSAPGRLADSYLIAGHQPAQAAQHASVKRSKDAAKIVVSGGKAKGAKRTARSRKAARSSASSSARKAKH